MKKFLITFCVLLFSSCSSSLLDTYPNDRYTEDTFWTSEKNAIASLTGCYTVLRQAGLYGGLATPLWEETATPNAYNYDNSMGFNVIANGTLTATNSSIVSQRYAACYTGIGRCNILLSKLDEVSMDDVLRDRMKGEAAFLRALYYYNLASYYGGVPLITDPPANDQALLPRNTREEVVAQILADLNEAASLLPLKYTGEDIGRATKGAALTLKAKVLLFEASPLLNTNGSKEKWELAAKAAKAVIELAPEAGYALYPNYRNLFLPVNDNSVEAIFSVQFKAPEQGSSFDLVGQQYNTNAPVKGVIESYNMRDGQLQNESPLYNASKPYENRDPRMYQTIVYPGDTFLGTVTTVTLPFKITGYGIKKYTVYDKGAATTMIAGGRSETNYMIFRYADVLLMYAEAQNEAVSIPDESVYLAIEEVRKRAGLQPFEIERGRTQEQMRNIIQNERRVEFMGEGYYYNDIRRWKLAEVVMNAPIFDSQSNLLETRRFNALRDYWWPIPSGEIDTNPNLIQNLNY